MKVFQASNSKSGIFLGGKKWRQIAKYIKAENCNKFKKYMDNLSEKEEPAPVYDALSVIRNYDQALLPILNRLDKLIGLADIKATMGKLHGVVQLSAWKNGLGMKPLGGQSFHMRFLGNPGTRKTVVARIV